MTSNCNMTYEDNDHNPQHILCDGVRCEIDGWAVKTWQYAPYGRDGGIIRVRYTNGGYGHYKIDGAAYMDECPAEACELTTAQAIRILDAINMYNK